MQWVKNRLIPALKAAYPQCFSATRDAHMTIVMDRAPYHCASSGDRFNPLDAGHKPSREALVDKMRAIMAAKGHAATLVVTHKNVVQAPSQPPADVVLNVALDDAEKARKGKPGVNAAVGELRAAAYAWLIEHSPETLLNDVEAYLRAECPRVHVLWSAPNCPELNPIEMAWARAQALRRVQVHGQALQGGAAAPLPRRPVHGQARQARAAQREGRQLCQGPGDGQVCRRSVPIRARAPRAQGRRADGAQGR
jgi:hypothetical protein